MLRDSTLHAGVILLCFRVLLQNILSLEAGKKMQAFVHKI